METQSDPGDTLMNDYLRSLKRAQDQLETARSGLEAILVPGQDAYK